MEKFAKLCSKCKFSVEIWVNNHRDIYQTVEDYFLEQLQYSLSAVKMDDVVDPEIYKKCLETNTIVYVHFYPRNSNTFLSLHHYDVDMALDQALKMVDEYWSEN